MAEKDENQVTVQTVEGTSKKGNKYVALEIKIGEYRQLIFLSTIERMYIEHILESQ